MSKQISNKESKESKESNKLSKNSKSIKKIITTLLYNEILNNEIPNNEILNNEISNKVTPIKDDSKYYGKNIDTIIKNTNRGLFTPVKTNFRNHESKYYIDRYTNCLSNKEKSVVYHNNKILCFKESQILYMVYFMTKILPNIQYYNIMLNNDEKGFIFSHGAIGFLYRFDIKEYKFCIKFINARKNDIIKTNNIVNYITNDMYKKLDDNIFLKKLLDIYYVINNNNNYNEVYSFDIYNDNINYLSNNISIKNISPKIDNNLIIQLYERASYDINYIKKIDENIINLLLDLLNNYFIKLIEFYKVNETYYMIFDVKTSNIVYDENTNKIKIIDFDDMIISKDFFIENKKIPFTPIYMHYIYYLNKNVNTQNRYFTILYDILCLFISIHDKILPKIKFIEIINKLCNLFMTDIKSFEIEFYAFYNKHITIEKIIDIFYNYSLLFLNNYTLFNNRDKIDKLKFIKCKDGIIEFLDLNLNRNYLLDIYNFLF